MTGRGFLTVSKVERHGGYLKRLAVTSGRVLPGHVELLQVPLATVMKQNSSKGTKSGLYYTSKTSCSLNDEPNQSNTGTNQSQPPCGTKPSSPWYPLQPASHHLAPEGPQTWQPI